MWSKFTITSPDPVPVVRDRLAAALTTTRPGMLSGVTTFRGSVSEDGFRVVRNPALTERTMPLVATGRFAPSAEGTVVEVKTYPQWSWLSVIVAFMAIALLGPLRILMTTVLDDARAFWTLIGFLIVIGGCALMTTFVGYTIEERRYQEALTKLVRSA